MSETVRPGYPPVRGFPGLARCRVVGVLNITPDSFSDGGLVFDADAAVRHGLTLLTGGADLLDVGGESTRPGAARIPEPEELRRVRPVVQALASAGAVVSVDTTRARVAEAALGLGARVVNDVSGGLADPGMVPLIAAAGVPYVVMHSRGPASVMQSRAVYANVVLEVCDELRARLDAVVGAGVDPECVIVDPGLGFAKTGEHNWALLAHLDRLRGLDRPVLVGASRKAFLGHLLASSDATPRPVLDREDATTAVTALAAAAGAWAVRVHEARASADAVRVAARWVAG